MTRFILSLILLFPAVSFAQVAQIIVPVSITYQGRTVTTSMAIDTGATVTTIDSRLADQLGINRITGSGLAQMADGRTVQYQTAVMGITVSTMTKTMPINIMDYSANREASGMIGLDFLSTMTMTLDWKNRLIYWSE
jgi:predicted aspartyl protease